MHDVNDYFKLPQLTLPTLLEYSYKKFAKKECVSIVDKEPISYAQFYEKVLETIALLKASGVTSGDKVAILSENLPQWGISYFAITSMGGVAVPILTDFHKNEVMHIINHSEQKPSLYQTDSWILSWIPTLQTFCVS
jgi:long-chain acyl-CoA synthetase